jgi:hypothetical protein
VNTRHGLSETERVDMALYAAVAGMEALNPLGWRRRPARGAHPARHVRMPRTRSFTSGHAASPFAFATGVADTQPQIALPLRALAYSRVHTGVKS